MRARATRILLKALFIALVWGGTAYVLAVPLLRASPDPERAWQGQLGHWLLRPFCHQAPERCFRLAGRPMPLCARCFGLLSGGLAATLGVWLWPAKDLARLRRLFAGAALFMAVDVALNWIHLYKIDLLRWLTGLMLGFVSSLILMQGVDTIEAPQDDEQGGPVCP